MAMMNPFDSDPISADEHCGFSQRQISSPCEQKNDEGWTNQNIQIHSCMTEVGAQQQFHEITEVQDEFWLSDEKPYFHCIIRQANLKYLFRLIIPVKMHHILPEKEIPVVLTFGNKNWVMSYSGNRPIRRFDNRWKNFAVDNNLKLGDGCVFELLECSEALIKFRVQILSGDIPPEFLDRVDGKSPNHPILIQ